MITNNYLFSSQFLNYLMAQKVKDDGVFEGFASCAKNFLGSRQWENIDFLEKAINNILSYLQFAYSPQFEFFNNRKEFKYCYLYEGYPLTKKVSCLYLIPSDKDLNSAVKGDFPVFDLIYLLKKEKLEWGIITNGTIWRLYSTLPSQLYESYLEIDFSDNREDNFKVFYRLFSLYLFIPDENEVTPLEKYIDESAKEAKVIEDHIKNNIDKILEDICFGFLSYAGRINTSLSDTEKKRYFENAVYLLFRLLFIFYAEARGLLPIDSPAYKKISLNSLLETARQYRSTASLAADATTLWDAFRDLCINIDTGNPDLNISEYDGGLFDSSEHAFLSEPQNKLTNSYFAKILYSLGYLNKHNSEVKIEYRDISVRSLGSLYEGILEYKLFISEEEIVKRAEKFIPASAAGVIKKSDKLIPKGHVYFSQDADERHDTGSYYTPEDVVNYMVQNSVRLGLEERWIDFMSVIKRYEDELRKSVTEDIRKNLLKRFDKELINFVEKQILTFKTLDPSMGSGHFLVNALNTITHFILEVLQAKVKISDGPIKHDKIPVDINWTLFENYNKDIDLTPSVWRRQVVEKCIFGIDINPLAAELAKLSLWIASASEGKPLTFLNHHLKCGDSIMGIRLEDTLKHPETQKQHESGQKQQLDCWELISEEKVKEIKEQYVQMVSKGSDIMQDVLLKKDKYEEIEKSLFLNHLKDMATLWLMISFKIRRGKKNTDSSASDFPDEKTYFELLGKAQVCETEEEWQKVLGNDLYNTIKEYHRQNKIFHWELEFPEIIDNGFEAVIGNPPYVDTFADNFIGLEFLPLSSNNLYCYILSKAVMCRGKQFKLSLIIPMSIIVSKRMTALRENLLKLDLVFRFTNIDSTSHPGTLFKNVNTQITILSVSTNSDSELKLFTSNYTRFYAIERKGLFKKIRIQAINNKFVVDNIIPKISTNIEESILGKMFLKNGSICDNISDITTDNYFYYRSSGNPYYRLAFEEPPFFEVNALKQLSSKAKIVYLNYKIPKYLIICLFHSSLFYWFWTVYSNCFDFTLSDLNRFPINLDEFAKDELKELCLEIQEDLKNKGRIVTYRKIRGITRYLELKPRYSKHLFDRVDKFLGEYYGFTDEELNFIINYDIKYRTD